MAGKDIITVSQKEMKKVHVVEGLIRKHYGQKEASEQLGLGTRQVRRLIKRYLEEGEQGMAHKLRGQESNRAYDRGFRENIIKIYEERYNDFGPVFASEKLEEVEGIRVNGETLRLWLLKEEGIRVWQRKKRRHRKKRERKMFIGIMVQMDGSHHDWLEGRGPKLVLIGYIDDATGKVYARFYKYEGTIPALDSFKRYIRKNGLPQVVYFDRHTTYKSTRKSSIEDELLNREALSQFGRALKELGVDFIHARSPQAKGRVERMFRTFQDRLVKEMRLVGIKTLEEANDFLDRYLPKFNKRFNVKPLEKGDMHRKIPKGMDIDSILCIKTERALRNDYTVMHNRKFYQILDKTRAKKVLIEERLNGKLYITYKGQNLKYREIEARFISAPRRSKIKTVASNIVLVRKGAAKKHPWRNFVINPYRHRLAVAAKEKEAKRNKMKDLLNVADTAAHVEIDGQHGKTCVDHNSHNRLNNSKKAELFTVSTTRRLCPLFKRQKADISTLVESGHF